MNIQRQIYTLIARKTQFFKNKDSQHLLRVIHRNIMTSEESVAQSRAEIIAISQMCSTNDKEANMRQVETLIEKAKAASASFLFLPECCDFVGETRKQTLELSEPLTGGIMQQYKELAKRNCMWLSLGGVHEAVLDASASKTDKIFNAHVIINAKGEIVSIYRKLHLFDVSTAEFRFRESEVVAPGQRLVPPLTTPIGKLGLQICYDVRFAEASLLLAQMGAHCLTYPSAFAYTTGKAHWEILLRARAIENQCYVIASAQVGQHNAKRRSWGHAMIVSPLGEVLANCGPDATLAVATAKLDLTVIEKAKESMPCFEHRRNDIYGLTAYNVGRTEAEQDRLFASNTICKRTIFYESQYSYAFTNLRCVVVGHVLVSPKRNTPRLNGLNCAEMADLFATACRIQRMLEDIYSTTAATLTVQDGVVAGQTVPHVHFHIMPRRPGDFSDNEIYVKLEDRCDRKPSRSMEERVEEAQKYRDYLNNQL